MKNLLLEKLHMARGKNPALKRANTQHEYTIDQIMELQKCADDPVYFVDKYCKMATNDENAIEVLGTGVAPFHPRPYQINMLNSFKDNRFSIVLSARQTGKSWTAGAYLLWYAMFHETKTIGIASNKNSNAMEMISRVRFIYERLPLWLKPGLTDDGWNKHSVAFDNGSRIISAATSSDSFRGYTMSLLFLDEFAFVKPNIQEDFWTSIAPTLATGGSCIICSTPNGDSDRFAQLWRGAELGTNGFHSIEVKWDDPPGRDEKFKEGEIGRIGKRKWEQEYECQFISSDALLFDSLHLLNLTKQIEKVVPIEVQGETVWYKKPQQQTTYLAGIDPATGVGNDFTSLVIYEFPSMEQVCEYRSNTTSPAQAYHIIKRIFTVFERLGASVYFTVENNGVGQSLIALYEADEDPIEIAEFISESGKKKYGMVTTGKSKMRACITFKEMIERNTISIKSMKLLKEMKEYVRKGGSYQARLGSTDDLISASLLVVRLLEEMSSFDQEAYEKLYQGLYFEGEELYDDEDTPLDFLV